MRRSTIYLCLLTLACAEPQAPESLLDVADVLGTTATQGFARATAVRELTFPRDHGPHPAFRSEWWYLTGNLETGDGRRFGYQLTIFRNGLKPKVPPRTSEWASRELWMAHFALTDAAGKRLHAHERFARGGLQLAGARSEPFRVWLEDWSIESTGNSFLPLRVRARDGAVAIDLELSGGKPLVLQGDRGLSQKSSEPGNASYYYSFTRLETRGTVRVAATDHQVAGTTWFDREWSTSALAEDQSGWDWFAIQLDDGSELMFYQLRRRDGSQDPSSRGTFVTPSGASRSIAADAIELTVLDEWTSGETGVRYPSRWRLRVPAEELDLQVTPVIADQELRVSFRYWEGAVDVSGRRKGRGYVEMTGYRPPAGAR